MIDKGPARSVINKRIGMLKRMFRWAASHQLVPVTVYQALATVENLKAGRSRAKEHKTAYRGPARLIAIGPKAADNTQTIPETKARRCPVLDRFEKLLYWSDAVDVDYFMNFPLGSILSAW